MQPVLCVWLHATESVTMQPNRLQHTSPTESVTLPNLLRATDSVAQTTQPNRLQPTSPTESVTLPNLLRATDSEAQPSRQNMTTARAQPNPYCSQVAKT